MRRANAKVAVLVLVLMVAGLTAMFGGGAPAQSSGKVSVSMVTDTGGVNDQSFNQSAWEGLQRAKSELGVNVSYVESAQEADYARNLDTLRDSNQDLIWGIGFLMGDAILNAAKANPNQKYAIIDFAYENAPANVIGVLFREQEPSFLVGYIAGKMTKTGVVGFVGGIESELIGRFQYGFQAGVAFANPNARVLVQYAASFTDAAKGKSIALQFYQNGADIVYHAAGGVGDGVIEAAKEQGKWAIGVDRDQNYIAPNNVLTSAMKRVDNAIYNIVADLAKGVFNGGQTVVYGLAEGGVDIAPTSSMNVPADILAEVEALKRRIISGDLVIPADAAGFAAFNPRR